jgi:hypothetical protein
MIVWWSSEGKFNKNKFFLIPSLVVNLPHDWQDNFVRADNLKCLTLYPSQGRLDLLRNLSRKNESSISDIVRKTVDSYLQKKSWGVNIFPRNALRNRSCKQLSVYLFEGQINKLKYVSSQTNCPVIDLVTEAISKYSSQSLLRSTKKALDLF